LSELLYRICAALYLGGNAIISKVRGLGTVAELWTLGPNGIQPIPNREEFISGYLYTLGGKKQTLPAEDIIHLQFPDPATPYWGTSPLMAAARAVDTEQSAMTFQQVGLQNRAVTDGVLSYKMDLTKKQYEKYREQINEQMMGPSNARKMIITGHDADYKQLSLSPAEMDFIESRKFGREEICAAHQVPPPVVGIYENATLANIETARKIFWIDTVIPLLGQIRDALNVSLTPEFGEDIRINYDVLKVEALWPVFKERIEAARKLWEMGVPFNELNRRFELDFNDIHSGDMGFIPSTMVPADMFQADTLTDEE
jgi:HK97 family phage portal protein